MAQSGLREERPPGTPRKTNPGMPLIDHRGVIPQTLRG